MEDVVKFKGPRDPLAVDAALRIRRDIGMGLRYIPAFIELNPENAPMLFAGCLVSISERLDELMAGFGMPMDDINQLSDDDVRRLIGDAECQKKLIVRYFEKNRELEELVEESRRGEEGRRSIRNTCRGSATCIRSRPFRASR